MHSHPLFNIRVLLLAFTGLLPMGLIAHNPISGSFVDAGVKLFGLKVEVENDESLVEEVVDDAENKESETLEERIVRLKEELASAEAELEAQQMQEASVETMEPVDIPTGALVVISSENTEGSGFIGEMRGKTFLITNIHVLGAARNASVQTLDGSELNLAPYAYLSQERDIALVPLIWNDIVLPVAESLTEGGLSIDHEITVIGNSDGTRVATQLKGTVEGIGPKEIQVSAKFVPGNSGSPIIHDASGKVVAVASYLRDLSSDSKWSKDTELEDIRRFGYRLDGAIQWEKIELNELYEQYEAFQRFSDRTMVMGQMAYMMEFENKIMTGYRSHESLGHLLEYFENDFQWQRGVRSANNTRMLKRFVEGLLAELQSDCNSTENSLRVSFYKQRFKDMKNVRDEISHMLERFKNMQLN